MRLLPDAVLTTLSAKVLSRLLFTVSTGFSESIQLAIVFNKTEIKLLVSGSGKVSVPDGIPHGFVFR